jgi:hypothetical protein
MIATKSKGYQLPERPEGCCAQSVPFQNECGGQMKDISFIEPPQTDVIEAILRHCGVAVSITTKATGCA